MKLPNFEVVQANALNVTVRDVGPWDRYPTITNAAEELVEELTRRCLIRNGVQLGYYDSEGEYGQLLHEDGKFIGFRYGAAPEARR